MSFINKKLKNELRGVLKEYRNDISYITVVSVTTAACTTCSTESMTGLPLDSFCEDCGGKGYTETEGSRIMDATVTYFDTKENWMKFLKTGGWEPGTIQVIVDKEESINPVTNRTYFRESKYIQVDGDNYHFVSERIGNIGLTTEVIARKV